MADTKKCDKCGEYMELTSSRAEITLETKFQGMAEPKHFDLCVECQRKFYIFLREKEDTSK